MLLIHHANQANPKNQGSDNSDKIKKGKPPVAFVQFWLDNFT